MSGQQAPCSLSQRLYGVPVCVVAPRHRCAGSGRPPNQQHYVPLSQTATRPKVSSAMSALPGHRCQAQDSTANVSQPVGSDQHATSSGRRRALLAGSALAGFLLPMADAQATSETVYTSTASRLPLDTSITQQVYIDVGLAETAWKSGRTLGDRTVVPTELTSAGRIVIGLYGNLVPVTVSNFLKLVQSGALTGTIFSRIVPGEYVLAGKQGSKRMGEVEAPQDLQANPEISSADAFRLPHLRPGTVSLSVSENDEDPSLREEAGYHSVEFLITTGPGPVPRLDGANIVFGRVLDGMSTVSALTSVPVFKPNETLNAYNSFAAAIGDSRAGVVRRKYYRPLKAVVITAAGVLPQDNTPA